MSEIIQPQRGKGFVHKLIAETCNGLAREYWEQSATRDNAFYKMYPDADLFVARNWFRFNEIARSCLVDLLAKTHHPASGALITPEEKAEIYDALKLNGAVNARKVDTKVNKLITPDDMLLPSPNGAPRNVH